MGMVTVKNLKKVYGDFTAVDGISFDIQKGEIFGFLGPNGAGKTSTINMLIGLSRPTEGMISINGIDGIKDIKKAQSIMGIVPDESNLYDEMDGFHNLCFCASLYGMGKKEREKRAQELLEQFSLKDAGNRPFKAYSKGMRRKLTIAAGIIHNPKILFLDEPTTGIDVESARQIRSLILDMKERGTTVFLTTHYIEEAERICDRIALLSTENRQNRGCQPVDGERRTEHIIRLRLDDGANGIKMSYRTISPIIKLKLRMKTPALLNRRLSLPCLQYCNTLMEGVFLF